MKTADSLFECIDEILSNEEKPSIALSELSESQQFIESPFGYMNRLKETEQSKVHHPEGNVWIHTMMVVDEAAKNRHLSKNPKVLMWAAFLHDIGKPETTRQRKGKITSYDHDKAGAVRCEHLLKQVCQNQEFIREVTAMVRWHMQILFVVKDMPFADVQAMKQQVDIKEVAILGKCDRLGRLGVNRKEVEDSIQKFIKKIT